MPKPPSFRKLVLAGIVILIVSSVGYVGLMVLREGVEPEISGETQVNEQASENVPEVGTKIPPSRAPDTSNWGTYRNEEFGFEIEYPPELVGLERVGSNWANGGISFDLPTQPPTYPYVPYSFRGSKYIAEGIPDACELPPESASTIKTYRTISGLAFTRIEERTISPSRVSIVYTAKKGDICFRFQYHDRQRTDIKEHVTRFDQIASTFQLIE